ncbi:hypothetical protein H0S70_13480 [Chryseobacterium manosquense]|uniref:Lipopolysaccharide biosynthesis protein n=1 Tax=Chryseobacterium manosquense TaxID=2754694 RepID=A0A7H1DWF5_9FLAO|nr:hypothetical protein [Chryseobacterium manosquense]QNS41313.1 hypothetical protein H0S70_13480 [Chryseobacterium manosquense]
MQDRRKLTFNSLILTLRMFVSMLIALYTSRVILQNLGQIDYGVYNVVAGVIGLFSFIQTALVGATSRFLAFELGIGNERNTFTKILNSSLTIHIITSLLLLLLAETIGIYFINYVIQVPQDKIYLTNIIYQFSVINTIIIFLSLPFESVLVAYEKMNVYALFSVLESVIKLVVALLIGIFDKNRMFYYALLLLVATFFLKSSLTAYVCKKLENYKFKFIREKEFLSPLLNFFSWDLYGNFSIVMQSQGVNILQNVFFGPIANASIALASQVQAALGAFSNNILYAIKPQIIKSFARNDLEELNKLINLGTKFSFIVSFLISFPIFFKMDAIVNLWLVNPPKYVVSYAKIAILINLFGSLVVTINHAIHATGKIKAISFITGTIYLLILPLSYIAYLNGYPSVNSYYITLTISIIVIFINQSILKLLIPYFNIKEFICNLIKITVILIISFPVGEYMNRINFANNIFFNILIFSFLTFLVNLILIYLIVLNKSEKKYLVKLINKKNGI